jgi:hypothetical protein
MSFEDGQAVPLLQELVDRISHAIILSTIDIPKTAQQISLENNLPLSSTYKKIRRLQVMNVLCIDKIHIDDSGKKVIFYKSKIKSMEFHLGKEGPMLRFERNDHPCRLDAMLRKF